MSMTAAADLNRTPSTSTSTGPMADRRLGWKFRTPPPRLVDALIKQKKLCRVDRDVLGILLDFRTHFKDSAWCCKRTIADQLGRSLKTVQRSLQRLGLHGIIRQVQVASPGQPDPDEPRNKTGWRIYFLWITTRSDFGPAPDRRTPDQRTKMSSPPETILSSPGGTILSSPPPCAIIGFPRGEFSETEERENRDDDGIASARQTAEIDACMSSSFPDLSPQIPISIPTHCRPTPRIPLASAMPAQTPRVPRFDPMASAAVPAIDLALLSALVARASRLMRVSPEVARETLLGLVREFGRKADRAGLEFGLWWLVDVMDSGEKRARKEGNLPVRDWRGYLAAGLRNKLESGGMPEPLAPRVKPLPPAAAPPCPPTPREPDKPVRPGYLREMVEAHMAGDLARIAALQAEGGCGA
jgi:hypothetical protein